MMVANCAQCRNTIRDDYLFNVEGHSNMAGPLHKGCLRCVECGDYLESKCYTSNNLFYCKRDFYRLFGPRCGGCHLPFDLNDEATKFRDDVFYHPDCIVCSVCHCAVSAGQNVQVSSADGLIYCEDHSFMCQMKATLPQPSSSAYTTDSGIETDLNTSEMKEQPKTPTSSHGGDDGNDDGDLSDSERRDKENKRRGPRTTIKAKQLEVLKNVFSNTPKPTRLMREQLAKETGLPMRVIQVWFQNKRSKEKRMHQMRFMARGPFLPPNARHPRMGRPFPPYGADPRMCFPPNAMPPQFDYPPHHPPPPPNFECGPGGMPPQGYPDAAYSGFPMGPGAFPEGSNSNDSFPNGGSENPLHAFPSPPPQNQDYPEPPTSSPEASSGSESGGITTLTTAVATAMSDQCYPSPPLSLEHSLTPLSTATAPTITA